MNLIEFSALAQKQIKELSKTYRSIPEDMLHLIDEINADPRKADDLGGNLYKRRFAIESKGKGKSGSGRAIYVLYQFPVDQKVVIVEVFDKSDKENISPSRLKELKKLYKNY